jgi:hypothetical protein
MCEADEDENVPELQQEAHDISDERLRLTRGDERQRVDRPQEANKEESFCGRRILLLLPVYWNNIFLIYYFHFKN